MRAVAAMLTVIAARSRSLSAPRPVPVAALSCLEFGGDRDEIAARSG